MIHQQPLRSRQRPIWLILPCPNCEELYLGASPLLRSATYRLATPSSRVTSSRRPFNPNFHLISDHQEPYALTFLTDSIHSAQTEESLRQPESLRGDIRRAITSNSGRSSPDRSKIASRNTIITENASSNAKYSPDELICALQNSELRALPAVATSANASRQSSHIAGSLGKPFAHRNDPPEDNRSTKVSCPPPLSIYF